MYTIYKLSHFHTHTRPHTPCTQSTNSLTFIHTLIHIHHVHNLQTVSLSSTHSSTYTMYTIYKLFHFHTHTHSHTPSHTRQMLRILEIYNTLRFEENRNRYNYMFIQFCKWILSKRPTQKLDIN